MKTNMQQAVSASKMSWSHAKELEFIWLELTEKCNLECVHCYAESGPKRPLENGMNEEDWSRVISQAAELGCKQIQFIGGEVLLVPYLRNLILTAKYHGFEFIEVFTNATILNDDILEFFLKHGVELATSFYCARADVHDQITQRRGSWAKTVNAIERIHTLKVPLRVGIIEMDLNRIHIDETKDFIQRMGITKVGVDHARSVGRGATLKKEEQTLDALCGHCGNKRVCIASTGKIFPCIMARSDEIGNVFEHGLSGALKSRVLSDFKTLLANALGACDVTDACSPGCWPHGGCTPHDICLPLIKTCKPKK